MTITTSRSIDPVSYRPTIVNGLPPMWSVSPTLLRLALGVGVVAGDLPADDDVRLALVRRRRGTALPVLLERPGIDGALAVRCVRVDVLPLDHGLVEQVDCAPLRSRHPAEERLPLDAGGDLPDLGGDDPDARDRPQLSRRCCAGRSLKTGLGAFSRRTISPSTRLGVADHVPQAAARG